MKCIYCNCTESRVVDSRPTEDGAIRRRRECEGCQRRFTTYEKIEMLPVFIIKKDKRREQFDPNKVRGVAMSVAVFALWVGTYLIGQFTPLCMATLGSSGTFFFFAAMCVPYMLIMWRLVPETTGKSLEEIEKYWTKK